MQIQQSVGKLEVKVDQLNKSSDKQSLKIDSISHRIYAAGVVLTISVAIIGFILNKMWDSLITLLTRLPPVPPVR